MPLRNTRVDSRKTDAPAEALTVAQLTQRIKTVLEPAFTDVLVEGEISNYTHHRSGHRYFTLKDADAMISATLWKSRPVNFDMAEGMKVVCRGRLAVYAPRGQYNLDVFQIRPVGVGALQLAYEKLFAKLEAEGLFDEARKRPIPRFPATIGVVTSETGAALHDILTVLRRRFPIVKVILRPASVQGVGMELQIAQAIREFNLLPTETRPDVLIVGRGGGSLEDLWNFNEEAVARAIFASKIPVISAVGHEVDFTIADYVADLRAPTPTAAAELAAPDMRELRAQIAVARAQLDREMKMQCASLKQQIAALGSAASLASVCKDRIAALQDDIQRATDRMVSALKFSLERTKLQLERDAAKLGALSPFGVLERGYTMFQSADGAILSTKEIVNRQANTTGVIIFADGKLAVRWDDLAR